MLSNGYTILVYGVAHWKSFSVMECADKGFLGSLVLGSNLLSALYQEKIRGIEDVMLFILFKLLKY